MSEPVRGRLHAELRLVGVALQFLTRIPVPAFSHWDERWLNDCVRHFPLVGAAVGAIGGAVLWVAAQFWSPTVAALLAVAATALVTGAFHEDGLADSFDALGGAVGRERALEIMKDSRIGSYGAVALVLVTALRVMGLASLAASSPVLGAVACTLGHAMARLAPIALMAALPYGGDVEHAKAKPLATRVAWSQLGLAGTWVAALSIGATLLPQGLGAWGVLAALLSTAGVALGLRRWLARRLGGYTGDTLGASEQLAEAAIWLALAAVLVGPA